MRLRILPALCFLSFAACSGNEIVGMHVTLRDDGSAEITTRALAPSTAASAVEALLPTVAWTGRASLQCSQGTVPTIQNLKFSDDSLQVTSRLDTEFPGLRIKVKRGPSAGWVRALVPAEVADRRKMARLYDPTGRTKEVGDVLRLEITVPKNIVGSSVQPAGRGITADREGKRAFLLVPATTALEAGDDLTWDITWADTK